MAFVMGVEPESVLAGANTALPYNYPDFAFVGGLRNEAIKMVKCETIDGHHWLW